jgi:hypothetical protein
VQLIESVVAVVVVPKLARIFCPAVKVFPAVNVVKLGVEDASK